MKQKGISAAIFVSGRLIPYPIQPVPWCCISGGRRASCFCGQPLSVEKSVRQRFSAVNQLE